MAFQYITIQNFRNLEKQRVDFSPHINIVNGKNGSGKSSLLESIYYLSVGKSFRSSKLDAIVNHDELNFTLFTVAGDGASPHRIGITREKNKQSAIKVDGEFIRSATQLAEISPTLVVDPETFELLDGGPGNRRRYMDWGVFHVEHRFSQAWRHYTKSLKQRNTLLRRGRIDRSQVAPWDAQMVKLAHDIDEFRKAYILSLVPVINSILDNLNNTMDVNVSYYRGWDKKSEFSDVLDGSFLRDSNSGYTHHGPHRADIKIKVGGKNADDVLSRGQKKILIFAMILAQGQILHDRLGRDAVYLIDDISAELDVDHRQNICKFLEKHSNQVILTVVDSESIAPYFSDDIDKRMFHVEHGCVSQVN